MVVIGLFCSTARASENLQGDQFKIDATDSLELNRILCHKSDPGPIIGLALSGGGARGIAHIGVLKVLDSVGIRFDLVSGTSMGGLVGGLYACGFSPDSIEKIANSINWSALFSNRPQRTTQFITQKELGENSLLTFRLRGGKIDLPRAFTSGQNLNALLASLTSRSDYLYDKSFDNFPVPLRICAVDLISGRLIVFDKGYLSDALRATTSFPLAFDPLEKSGMLLVDGGLLAPIPVEVVRSAGCKYVIAVNTTSKIRPLENINNPIDIIDATTTIMQSEKKNVELGMADLVITPDLEKFEATAFNQVDSLVQEGRAATLEALPQIWKILDAGQKERESRYLYVDSVAVTPPEFREKLDLFLTCRDSSAIRIAWDSLKLHLANLIFVGQLVAGDLTLQESQMTKILQIKLDSVIPLKALELVGTALLNDSQVLGKAEVSYGEPLDYQHILRIKSAALELLHVRGADLANVKAELSDAQVGTLRLKVDEGRVLRFVVSGNAATKGWVLKRNFLLKPGDVYSISKADSGLANIYASGLFDQVFLNLDRGDSGVTVKISVKERPPEYIRLGFHQQEYFRTEAFADIGHINLFGFGNESFIRTIVGEFRQEYSLNLKADRIYETYNSYQLQIYHKRLKRELFAQEQSLGKRKEWRSGFSLFFGKQVTSLGNVGVDLNLSRLRLEDPNGEIVHTGLMTLGFSSRVDTRDRLVFASSGSVLDLNLEFGFNLLWGKEEYQKGSVFWKGYFPLWRNLHLIPAISLGLSANPLPPSEKFFMGGSREFFGYRMFELKGDKLFNSNWEIRYKLGRFYFSGRLDFGNVWGNWNELRSDDLLYGYGLQISYDSYLGPLRLAYGRSFDGQGRLYLDLGHDF